MKNLLDRAIKGDKAAEEESARKAVKLAKKSAGKKLKSEGGTGNKPIGKKTMEETMADAFDRANAN